MTALLDLTVCFTVWTLITVVVGAAIRNQEWTKEGRDIGLGNRDNLKEVKIILKTIKFFIPAHCAF